MLPWDIFTLLLHSTFSNTPCQNGLKIPTKEIQNPNDLLGNWFYAYHWDGRNKYSNEFVDRGDHSTQADCTKIEISKISSDYVKVKEVECANYTIPFNWADAKLKIDSRGMGIKGGILILGAKEKWLMVDCIKTARIVIRKVSYNYVVMSNLDVPGASEMIAKKIPELDELKCVSHNMDAVRGIKGIGLCYKN